MNDITKRPSEIAQKSCGHFSSFLASRPSIYELEEEAQNTKFDLKEDIRQAVLFLYEYINLDGSLSVEVFTESREANALWGALDEFAEGSISWTDLQRVWSAYVVQLQELEKSYIHEDKTFTYKGFEIRAIQTPPNVLKQFREAIDFAIDLFERRSLQINLHSVVERFLFRPAHKEDFHRKIPSDSVGAYYTANDKQVSAYWGTRSSLSPTKEIKLKKRDVTILKYVFIHEIAHGIYFHALSAEARKFWVSAWVARNMTFQDGDEDLLVEELPERLSRLRDLAIPTEYGHTNPSEDFAETLSHYLIDSAALPARTRRRLLGTLFHESNSQRVFKRTRKLRSASWWFRR